ncbi:MAG: hypothetical protein ACXV2F_03530 [Halobacteriota archaeon]
MARESEIVQKGMTPSGRITKIWKLPSTLTTIRRVSPDEERWVDPPRSNELPEYRNDLKYCSSKEKYLRLHDTAPRQRVAAFAHELDAYELPTREFAEPMCWWTKTNMWLATTSWYGVGETLERGIGSCWRLYDAHATARALVQVRPDNSSEQLSSFLRLTGSLATAEVGLP